MFKDCDSLTSLDLSNFNTENISNMRDIFENCKSLKMENIITKDQKILKYI